MESSAASPPLSRSNREKLFRRVIFPAIRGQNCPICLGSLEPRSAAVLEACKHAYCLRCIRRWSTLGRKCPLCNSIFDSWFDEITLSSRSFHRDILPPLNSTNASTAPTRSFRVHDANQRHVVNERRRSRPLPWRRSFGRPGSVAADVIAERKLHWRASIYDRRLQAVASAPANRVRVFAPVNDVVKERLLQRVEPWIRRELQVLLGEGDLSVVVSVAASLFVASLEKKDRVSSGQSDRVDDDFLEPMRPFLLDQTIMFWHELRCFAESPFNMETYDAVVEYRRLS